MKKIDPVIRLNEQGFAINKLFRPCEGMYGFRFNGYPNENREALFHFFAVQGYDTSFTYHGRPYYLLYVGPWVALSDAAYTAVIQRFENANLLIENLEIEGQKLIDIIDELENVQSN